MAENNEKEYFGIPAAKADMDMDRAQVRPRIADTMQAAAQALEDSGPADSLAIVFRENLHRAQRDHHRHSHCYDSFSGPLGKDSNPGPRFIDRETAYPPYLGESRKVWGIRHARLSVPSQIKHNCPTLCGTLQYTTGTK